MTQFRGRDRYRRVVQKQLSASAGYAPFPSTVTGVEPDSREVAIDTSGSGDYELKAVHDRSLGIRDGDSVLVQPAKDGQLHIAKIIGFVTPSCRVQNSGDITIATATDTELTFDTEIHDTDTMHSTSTNTGRITVKRPGIYEVKGCIRWPTNAVGNRQMYIRHNATIIMWETREATAGAPHRAVISTIFDCAVDDYFELGCYQNSGGNLNVEFLGSYSPVFMATWLGGTP